MFAALLLLAGSASAIDCPKRLTRDDLSGEIDLAEKAYADLDTVAFRDRMNGLAGLLLPCMGDLVPPELAARTHRVMALQQLELGNPSAAEVAIEAARGLDAGIDIPEAWLPADHPLRAALQDADAPSYGKAPDPRSGTLAFDGHGGRERPKDVPTIVQLFDSSGVAQTTAYVGPGDPLPGYAAIPHRRRALIGASGGAGAVGVALLTASWLQYRSLLAGAADPATAPTELYAGRASTNALYVAGGAFIGLGVGFGVGAAAVGPR